MKENLKDFWYRVCDIASIIIGILALLILGSIYMVLCIGGEFLEWREDRKRRKEWRKRYPEDKVW